MQTLIKEQANILLALFGKSVKRSKSLEVLSHCYGYPNWDTACKIDALDAYENRLQHDFSELDEYLRHCTAGASKLNAFIIGVFSYGLVFDNVDYIEQQTFLDPTAYKEFWQSCTRVQTHVLKGTSVTVLLPRLIRTISGGGYALSYSDKSYEAYLETKDLLLQSQHELPGKFQSMCTQLVKPIWVVNDSPKSMGHLLALKDNGSQFVMDATKLNDEVLASLGAQGSWLTTSDDGKIVEFVAASLVFDDVNPVNTENDYFPALDRQDVQDARFSVGTAKQVDLLSWFDDGSFYATDEFTRMREMATTRLRENIVLNDGFFLREPTKFDSMNRFQPLNALSEAIHDGDVRDESNITRVLSLSGLRLDQLIIDELALINLYMREGHKAKIRVNILTNAPESDTSRAWPSQLMDLLSKHLSIVYVYTPETDPKNVFDAIGLASVDTLPDFVIRRLHNSDVKCNVGHQVSWRSVDMSLLSDFEFGYMGTGPHELSINILYEMGVLHRDVCRRLTSTFTEEVLSYLPNEGGIIKRKYVLDWMLSKRQKVEQIWNSEF